MLLILKHGDENIYATHNAWKLKLVTFEAASTCLQGPVCPGFFCDWKMLGERGVRCTCDTKSRISALSCFAWKDAMSCHPRSAPAMEWTPCIPTVSPAFSCASYRDLLGFMNDVQIGWPAKAALCREPIGSIVSFKFQIHLSSTIDAPCHLYSLCVIQVFRKLCKELITEPPIHALYFLTRLDSEGVERYCLVRRYLNTKTTTNCRNRQDHYTAPAFGRHNLQRISCRQQLWQLALLWWITASVPQQRHENR